MSLVDDARRLFADDEPIVTVGTEEAQVYAFCNRSAYPDKGHAPDCPWMSRAKIVAALEAAWDLADILQDSHRPCSWCASRDVPIAPAIATFFTRVEHASDCPIQALIGRVRGEGDGHDPA